MIGLIVSLVLLVADMGLLIFAIYALKNDSNTEWLSTSIIIGIVLIVTVLFYVSRLRKNKVDQTNGKE